MDSFPFKVVIPARYGSTRLPGKPLLNIAGRPMIAHVCQRAIEAEAEEVVVATDDQRIFDSVTELGLNVVMTDASHQSGTERINEVAEQLGWNDDDIVVNLQGDEPLIPPAYIKDVALALGSQQKAGIATLAAEITDIEEDGIILNNSVYCKFDQKFQSNLNEKIKVKGKYIGYDELFEVIKLDQCSIVK